MFGACTSHPIPTEARKGRGNAFFCSPPLSRPFLVFPPRHGDPLLLVSRPTLTPLVYPFTHPQVNSTPTSYHWTHGDIAMEGCVFSPCPLCLLNPLASHLVFLQIKTVALVYEKSFHVHRKVRRSSVKRAQKTHCLHYPPLLPVLPSSCPRSCLRPARFTSHITLCTLCARTLLAATTRCDSRRRTAPSSPTSATCARAPRTGPPPSTKATEPSEGERAGPDHETRGHVGPVNTK